MKRIAFFIPHQGCPENCVFCNQHSISGTEKLPSFSEVEETLKDAAVYLGENIKETQVAFFGGSFTAIDKRLYNGYLDVAGKACEKYGYEGIRFSTRPDCISPEILMELENYPISHIELGVQSMNDKVLSYNSRGHLAEDTVKAVNLLKEWNIPFTLQMMVGLYKDTKEGALETGKKLVGLSPNSVRIYPTLVLKNTVLADLYQSGEYHPLTLEEAVEICGSLYGIFREAGIPVIRLGLHEEESLKKDFLAGPHHPAFGELCKSFYLYKRIEPRLSRTEKNEISIHPNSISLITGHGGWLKKRLENRGYSFTLKTDSSLDFYREEVAVQLQKGDKF